MKERRKQEQSVTVPQGAGVSGFLRALEKILRLPRVQDIRIDARGSVFYTRFVNEDEENLPLEVDFETLTPYSVIRSNPLVEIPCLPDPIHSLSSLLSNAVDDQLFPVAFVGGAQSVIWKWYKDSVGWVPKNRETLLSFPFLTDRRLDDSVLILCAGFARDVALIDTRKSYKVVISKLLGVENV